MNILAKFLIISGLLHFVNTSFGQILTEDFKSLPIPYESSDRQHYGASVAIEGDYAVIGAYGYNARQGCAYLLHYTVNGWENIARLTASDGEPNNDFGISVDISGDVVVIGANRKKTTVQTGEGTYTYYGAAYVFVKPESGWTDMTQTAKLLPLQSDGEFGYSVSISGETIVIGTYSSNYAYVYSRPANGWTDMNQTARLEASDNNTANEFGISVDNFGDVIVVGDRRNSGQKGAAYIFEKPLDGWRDMTETAKLTASDAIVNDFFGISVGIYNDVVVVGANTDLKYYKGTGSAYIFEKPPGGWVNMTQTAKLMASDSTELNAFGYSVDIYNENVVVGAHQDNGNGKYAGACYVYERPTGGWVNMTQTAKLTAKKGNGDDMLGYATGISNGVVLAGALNNDDNGFDAGAVYVYNKPATGWTDNNENQVVVAIAELNNVRNYYGFSVSIDGEYGVIGSPGYKGKGCAYVVHYSDAKWKTVAQLTASDGQSGDDFGTSVSISGNVIIAGASGDDDHGINSGAAYVFEMPQQGWRDTTETVKIVAADGSDFQYFGRSVRNSGTIFSVAAKLDGQSNKIYVFEKETNGGNIVEKAVLTHLGASNLVINQFMDMNEDIIVVGAANATDGKGNNSGAIYVYERPANGWADVSPSAKLTAGDSEDGDGLGMAVSISGDVIAGGAPHKSGNFTETGAAYLFKKPQNGWQDMSHTAKLTALDGVANDNFGYSVKIDSNVVVVGSLFSDKPADNAGLVYVFVEPESGWYDETPPKGRLYPSDAQTGMFFSSSIDISNDVIVVGAQNKNETSTQSGVAYWYETCFSHDSEPPTLTCPTDQQIFLKLPEDTYTVKGKEFDPVSFGDDCSIASLANNINSEETLEGEIFHPGSTVVKWTISDRVGNKVQCQFIATIRIVTGMEDIEKKGIIVYPNPAKKSIFLQSEKENILSFVLTDLNGKIITSKNYVGEMANIDLSGIKRGMYVLSIQTDKGQYSTKILKE